MDYILRGPAEVQVRWIDGSRGEHLLLEAIAGVVREFDGDGSAVVATPLGVARRLVAVYDALPPWTKRTRRLSPNARLLRHELKQARDPNRLLFDDVPPICDGGNVDGQTTRIAAALRELLSELQGAYGTMIDWLRHTLLVELDVHSAAEAMLMELRERAANVRELGGDQRLEAFIVRLVDFAATREEVAGIASLAADKPVGQWVDTDVDRAAVALADMSRQFLRAESFAHVKGRRNKRHAMAVMVGLEGRLTAHSEEFAVSDAEIGDVDAAVNEIESALASDAGQDRRIALAALARVSARYLESKDGSRQTASRRAEEESS